MTAPIIVIRPRPGCEATRKAGALAGLPVEAWPLFAIHPCDWQAPDAAQIDALLIGSANAIRHGGAALATFRGKPVYAVGRATADLAQAAGFPIAAVGQGGLQQVLERHVPRPMRLLRIAGAEHVALRPPEGIGIETRIAYRSEAQPMSPDLAERLGHGALVLLHSAAAARHFAAECDRMAIVRPGLRLAALGPRIARAAGGGWAELCSADHPEEEALLALVAEMWHDPRRISGEPRV